MCDGSRAGSSSAPPSDPIAKLWNVDIDFLGLVGRNGAGTHDLLRMARRRGRILDWAGESQYYVEPKRLARLGYLAARKEPGKTRERTVYTLTTKGLAALKAYARTPVTFTPVKSELVLRLLIADLVGPAVTRTSVVTLRDDIADLLERVAESEETAQRLPHRRVYLRLVTGYLRRLLALDLELVERSSAPSAAPRNRSDPSAVLTP